MGEACTLSVCRLVTACLCSKSLETQKNTVEGVDSRIAHHHDVPGGVYGCTVVVIIHPLNTREFLLFFLSNELPGEHMPGRPLDAVRRMPHLLAKRHLQRHSIRRGQLLHD